MLPSTITVLSAFSIGYFAGKGEYACGVESEAEDWTQVMISSTMASTRNLGHIQERQRRCLGVRWNGGRADNFPVQVEIPFGTWNLTT